MRVIFMGRRVHAVAALEWLATRHEVVRVVAPTELEPETPSYSPPLREVARARGLAVTTDVDLYEEISDPASPLGEIDLVISYLFWKRIKAPIIALGRFGCINFHPAPLPDYRGVGGFNFAILDRLATWAASAHYVDATFDTGPIIDVRRFAFDWRTATARSLEVATRPVIGALFRDTVDRIAEHGRLATVPNASGRYITRTAFEEAKRIEWGTLSPDEIDLRVRAFWYPPYDGAYLEKDGRRFSLVTPDILASLAEGNLPSPSAATSPVGASATSDERGVR